MRGLSRVLAVLAASLAAAAPSSPAAAQNPYDTALPFPVEKTTILRNEDAVYFVEGRKRIAKGVDITVLRGIKVIGRGKDATLEVEGNLSVHGVFEHEVYFEDVTIEPRPVFGNIRLDFAVFEHGGIVVPEKAPCSGYFMLELLDFVAKSKLDLTLAAGSVEMSRVCADTPVRVRAVDTQGDKGNAVKVEIRGCCPEPGLECVPHAFRIGLVGGLEVQGANEMIVRISRLGGALTAVRDWRKSLIFDGNKVDSRRLELTQPVAGRFSKAQFFKCDFHGERILFSAPPAKPGEVEEVPIERFWFKKAGTDRDAIDKAIEDGADAPDKNGVRVKVGKVSERPLELAGTGK